MKFIGKFILEGDEINPNNEPDEQGEVIKEWITIVVHDPADIQADGRWEGTIVQMRLPVRDRRWAGLYDKNSDKCMHLNSSYLRVTMMQNTRKHLRGVSQNTGNCWMVQKKEISEIF